jgi:CrcB protein
VLKLLLIGLGGAVGAVTRYGLAGWAQSLADRPTATALFPWGTLSVNVIGCLLMGLLAPLLLKEVSTEYRLMIMVGMLGAFTTWSSFGYETITMLSDGQFRYAAAYVAATNVACLAAVWIGYRLIERFAG